MIRVLIADDHQLVRAGIRALLEKAPDIEVVGEAADGQEAVFQAETLLPDVILMDIAMPRLNGTQAIRRIKSLGLPTEIVVLSMYSDRALIRQTIINGAKGYILKNAITEELLIAIRAVKMGECHVTPVISEVELADLLHNLPSAKEREFGTLSPREVEVLQLIAEGFTNQAIGRMMHISVKTVEKHRSSLMNKLEIRNVAGLVRVALKQGLVFLEK
jgi:DNA-binding NarL/FixJ family response regulator